MFRLECKYLPKRHHKTKYNFSNIEKAPLSKKNTNERDIVNLYIVNV